MSYNHFEYCRYIAKHLRGVDSFLESMGDEMPSQVDERLSRLSGTILVAVENIGVDLSMTDSDQLSERREYAILVLKQAPGSAYSDIRPVISQSRMLMDEILSKILQDNNSGREGLGNVDTDSITMDSAGPYADGMYGVILTFSLVVPVAYELDKSAWR